MSIQFDINDKRIQLMADRLLLLPKQLEKVVSTTANRVLPKAAKAGAWREVKGIYNVPKKDIVNRKNVLFYRATPGRMDARVVISAASNISLGHFLRPKLGPKKRPKVGPNVLVKRNSGKQPVKGAFLIRQPGGNPMFKREGDERLPIRKLYTAAPVRHLEKDEVQDRIYRDIEDGFIKEFNRYGDHILNKAGL